MRELYPPLQPPDVRAGRRVSALFVRNRRESDSAPGSRKKKPKENNFPFKGPLTRQAVRLSAP